MMTELNHVSKFSKYTGYDMSSLHFKNHKMN